MLIWLLARSWPGQRPADLRFHQPEHELAVDVVHPDHVSPHGPEEGGTALTALPAAISWAAIEFVLILTLVPETYAPALLKRRAKKLRKAGRTDVKAPIEIDDRNIAGVILMSCTRPFREHLRSQRSLHARKPDSLSPIT